jgi:hypothetical protein
MGCGCGRNSSNSKNNFKPPQSIPVIRTNTIAVSNNSNIDSKNKICRICPFSTKNASGIFDNNARCRKANRSISSILRDRTFTCPSQKF